VLVLHGWVLLPCIRNYASGILRYCRSVLRQGVLVRSWRNAETAFVYQYLLLDERLAVYRSCTAGASATIAWVRSDL
jgi:hypothetical protein